MLSSFIFLRQYLNLYSLNMLNKTNIKSMHNLFTHQRLQHALLSAENIFLLKIKQHVRTFDYVFNVGNRPCTILILHFF